MGGENDQLRRMLLEKTDDRLHWIAFRRDRLADVDTEFGNRRLRTSLRQQTPLLQRLANTWKTRPSLRFVIRGNVQKRDPRACGQRRFQRVIKRDLASF